MSSLITVATIMLLTPITFGLSCTTITSVSSLSTASASCNGQYPTLVSCGYEMLDPSYLYTRGTSIEFTTAAEDELRYSDNF